MCKFILGNMLPSCFSQVTKLCSHPSFSILTWTPALPLRQNSISHDLLPECSPRDLFQYKRSTHTHSVQPKYWIVPLGLLMRKRYWVYLSNITRHLHTRGPRCILPPLGALQYLYHSELALPGCLYLPFLNVSVHLSHPPFLSFFLLFLSLSLLSFSFSFL